MIGGAEDFDTSVRADHQFDDPYFFE